MTLPAPLLTTSPAIAQSGRFVAMRVDAAKIVASWRLSLFAHEWLTADGSIKDATALPDVERRKREKVEAALASGQPLDRPVLGIGIYDNVEIGAGRAVFLTLMDLGFTDIEVMVPIADYDSFAAYETTTRRSERGNVLYYILICIGLLAAINYAVATGSRSSVTSMTQDQQRLLAAELINYGDTLAKAATQLRLRGTAFNQLSLASAGLPAAYGTPGANPGNEIFNAQGGGVQYRKPPANALTAPANYVFTAGNGVAQVGSDCANASCSDLIAVAGPLVPAICTSIDSQLSILGSIPAVAAADVTTPFAGTASYTATIGAGAGDAALAGRTAGCFSLGGQDYFYQVLATQ